MQKVVQWAILAFCMLLLCGIAAAADEFTLQVNGVDYQSLNNPTFTWGDTITFSGTSSSGETYITLGTPDDAAADWTPRATCKGLQWSVSKSTHSLIMGEAWSYVWNTGDSACKYPNVDTKITIETMGGVPVSFPITMKAVVTPTPTPTPDYNAKIAAIETQVAQQNSTLAAHEKSFGEIMAAEAAAKNATATPTVVAAKPTSTVNYSATIAALEKRLDEQNAKIEEQGNFINEIMKFLGLQ